MLARSSGRNTLTFADLIEIWTWLVVVVVSIVGLGRIGTTLIVSMTPTHRAESRASAARPHQSQPIQLRTSPRRFFTVPREAVPVVMCLVAMHWLVLWRVLLRRRWACIFSGLYGWLFYDRYWGDAGWLTVFVAGLLLVIGASVVNGWRELTDGW